MLLFPPILDEIYYNIIMNIELSDISSKFKLYNCEITNLDHYLIELHTSKISTETSW